MRQKLFIALILLSQIFSTIAAPIGLITPLEIESQPIVQAMTNKKAISHNGFNYLTGKLNQQDVVLSQSGMGLVNVSLTTQHMIQEFKPETLYLIGSSGAIAKTMKKNMVVLGKKVTNVDFGALTAQGVVFPLKELMNNPHTKQHQPLTYEANELFDNNKDLNIHWGHIATSEMLPNSSEQAKLLEQAGFDVVEMEGAGFMQTCWFHNKSCLVIRGVSNETDEPITIEDVSDAAHAAFNALNQLIN